MGVTCDSSKMFACKHAYISLGHAVSDELSLAILIYLNRNSFRQVSAVVLLTFDN